MNVMTFRASRMNFLALTEPNAWPGSTSEQYQVAVPVSDIPDEIVNCAPHAMAAAAASSWGLYTFRSNRQPRIMGMAPESVDMKDLLDYCDWTQTPIESLLRDQPAEIACTLFEKSHPNAQDAYGIALTAIRIDPSKINRPSWDDLLSGKVPL